MQPTQQTIKPGVYTSEFWSNILISVLTVILPYVINMPDTYKVISALISIIPVISYTFQRGQVKQVALNNPPTRTINIIKQPVSTPTHVPAIQSPTSSGQ